MEEDTTEGKLSNHSVVLRLNCCIGAFALYPQFHLHTHGHHHIPHTEHEHQHEFDHEHDSDHPHHQHHNTTQHLDYRTHCHPPLPSINEPEKEAIESFIKEVIAFADSLSKDDISPIQPSLVENFFDIMTYTQFDEAAIYRILGDARIEERLMNIWIKLAIYEGGVELKSALELLEAHKDRTLSLEDVLGFKYGGDYQTLLETELKELFGRCPWLPSDRSSLHFVFVGAGIVDIVVVVCSVGLYCSVLRYVVLTCGVVFCVVLRCC